MARTGRPEKFRDKWRVRWLDHEGVRRAAFFDSFADAERKLRARKTEADDIKRGLRRATPADRTFSELADRWLETRANEKRSKAEDESIIRKHLRPALGALALRAIFGEHVERYKNERDSLSPKTVANHLTLLGTMLRLAVELGWLASAPIIRKPSVDPDDDTDQPWLRTEGEIVAVLEAARAEIEPDDPCSEIPVVLYSAAQFTGMRAGEIAGLRWSDVDLERRTIHVRRSYDGKTKTRASRRHVPIVDALLPTFRAWRLRCSITEGDFVFPNRAGRMHDESARVFQEVLHRVLDRAGFERPTAGRNKHVRSGTRSLRTGGSAVARRSHPRARAHVQDDDRALREHRWLPPARALRDLRRWDD